MSVFPEELFSTITTVPDFAVAKFRIVRQLAGRKKVPVHLVGGFVRDLFLRRPGWDFDFAVGKGAVSFARLFARHIKGVFVLLDGEHGCARVVKKEDGVPVTYDFADFRATSFRQDLRHRDFTINTLSIPLHRRSAAGDWSACVQDPLGGLKDLRGRRIRMTTKNVFQEDPLRLLRAFSLRAVLNFSIEPATLAQIKKERALIRSVSRERVREEIFKILESPRAALAIKAMDRSGLLEEILPELRVMFGVRQGTYHHLDVWPHSLAALSELEKVLREFGADPDAGLYLETALGGNHRRLALLKLAALLHDIGKPGTLRREGERISFHGHERVGREITRHVAVSLKLSTRERFALEDMVLWHLRPGYLSNFKNPSERAIFRYFRDTKDEAASIALLSLADQRATRGPLTTEEDQAHHEKICRQLVVEFFRRQKEIPLVRLITGDDLIQVLKLKPSPLFAEILQTVEEQQAMGQITSKAEALNLAGEIAVKSAEKNRKDLEAQG